MKPDELIPLFRRVFSVVAGGAVSVASIPVVCGCDKQCEPLVIYIARGEHARRAVKLLAEHGLVTDGGELGEPAPTVVH
jgi:hypothetical protein